MELIDMQKAFVELAQGARERIARALGSDKETAAKDGTETGTSSRFRGGGVAREDACRRNTG